MRLTPRTQRLWTALEALTLRGPLQELLCLILSDGKESACDAGDLGSDPWVRKIPWGENGNPLQYSCLENSMDRGAWWTTVHRVTKSRTRLSAPTHMHRPFLALKPALKDSSSGFLTYWKVLTLIFFDNMVFQSPSSFSPPPPSQVVCIFKVWPVSSNHGGWRIQIYLLQSLWGWSRGRKEDGFILDM